MSTQSSTTTGGSTRRSFLRSSVSVVGGMAAAVAALEPLKELDPEDFGSLEGFIQKHYKQHISLKMRKYAYNPFLEREYISNMYRIEEDDIPEKIEIKEHLQNFSSNQITRNQRNSIKMLNLPKTDRLTRNASV